MNIAEAEAPHPHAETSAPGLHRPKLALADAAIGAAAALLVFVLCIWQWERIPGLHIDEVWSILHAEAIRHGLRPLNAMNSYTGALPQYVMAVVTTVTQDCMYTARLCGAAAGAAYFFAYWLILTQFCPRFEGLWSHLSGALIALGLACAPMIIAYTRYSVEILTAVPLLIGAALATALAAVEAPRLRPRLMLSLLSMVLALLAVYAHLLAAAGAAGIIGSLLLVYRRRALIPAAVLVAGLVPMGLNRSGLLNSGQFDQQGQPLPWTKLTGDAISDCLQVLYGLMDGRIPAFRYAGHMPWDYVGYADSALVAIFLVGIPACLLGPNRGARVLLIASFITYAFVLMLIPYGADRYFQLPTLLLVFGLAGGLLSLIRRPAPHALWRHAAAGACLTLFVCYNAFGLWYNYFDLFFKTGGNSEDFRVSEHFADTSAHFTDLSETVTTVRQLSPRIVYATTFIEGSLRFFLERQGSRIPVGHLGERGANHADLYGLKPGDTAVVYKTWRPDAGEIAYLKRANPACTYDRIELANEVLYTCREGPVVAKP